MADSRSNAIGGLIRRHAARRRWLALVLLLATVGCRPDVSGPNVNEHPDLTGEWRYTAESIRPDGVSTGPSCTITGLEMAIGPWRATGFFGRTEGGTLECEAPYESLSGELASYAVARGGMVSNHIAFDLGNPDWRHQGFLSEDADTMDGFFNLRSGQVRLTGTFQAIRNR